MQLNMKQAPQDHCAGQHLTTEQTQALMAVHMEQNTDIEDAAKEAKPTGPQHPETNDGHIADMIDSIWW